MITYFLLLTLISLLWHMSLSTQECNRTISGGEITFICPSSIADQELALYDLTVDILDNITSIVATGGSGAVPVGPFTSIPPNICLLRNLQTVDFSSNVITNVDPTGSLTNCFKNVITLRLYSNQISQFPSVLIYNMPNLTTIDFHQNQLTQIPANAFANVSLFETMDFSFNQLTTLDLWVLDVQTSVNFMKNQISAITNTYFTSKFLALNNQPTISLSDNGPTINFTDAVYEMYNQCAEVQEYFSDEGTPVAIPYFTEKLSMIDFGTTQINCSCDQYYFLQILQDTYGQISQIPANLPIRTATCIRNLLDMANTPFINSSCASPTFEVNSTVDFAAVYPRFCKIYDYETGGLTPLVNISAPTLNVSTYPHYESIFMKPGACFCTFLNQTSMTMSCTNDTSNSLSTFPESLLTSSYMSDIERVTFPSPISSLPSYLCSLPSGKIDLSYQSFTTLTDATFPCLDSFTQVILSYNDLTSVNISNGNFQNLTILDLSSNRLTSIPYSILHPTPTSLRYLNLQNNSITSIDLFVYTLKNITINLADNPINSSSIINPENVTLENGTSTVNITYPSSVTNSTIIVQDSLVASFIACTSFTSIRSFLLNLKTASSNVVLLCTCASFSLKQLYQANGFNINNDFSCSIPSDEKIFQSLTSTSCPNATQFQINSCNGTPQISTEMTPMEFFNNSIELSSTPFTIVITTAPNTSNETEDTTSPEVILTSITMISEDPSTTTTTTTVSSVSSVSSVSLVSSVSPVQPVQSSSQSNNTPIIVGVVVGVGGFLILLAAIIAAILIKKFKYAAVAKKPISRAKIVGHDRALSSHVQPRNLRSVKLAPITAPTSELPKVPVKAVVPPSHSSLLSNPNTSLRTSARGIPIRLDPIRTPTDISPQYPPNSNALNNSLSFRPINNLSTHQVSVPQSQPQTPKPRINQMLNAGGDTRY